MSDLSRATLARKLKSAGLHQARNRTYADGFTLVEFVDYWGVTPSVPGAGADDQMVKQALAHLKLHWKMGNMILVFKDQDQPDRLGNRIAQEGCDRCWCGCKYWENDRCIDCGTHVRDIPCGAELTMGPTEGVLVCAREKGHNLKHETADGIPFSGDDSIVQKYLDT